MSKELFFSLEKNSYSNAPRVRLSSICAIYGANASPLDEVYFEIKEQALTITAFDVMTRLLPFYPGYTITNLGPTECDVFLKHAEKSPVLKILAVIFLCAVMFFGGAVAIMTFHEDVAMPKVHSDIYAFFTGERIEKTPVVSIPYSFGIAIGFVILFGLYRRKKKTPTVLDIDIHNHENELRDYLATKSRRSGG